MRFLTKSPLIPAARASLLPCAQHLRAIQAEEVAKLSAGASAIRQIGVLRRLARLGLVWALLCLPWLPALAALRPLVELARASRTAPASLQSLRRRRLLATRRRLLRVVVTSLAYSSWLVVCSANLLPKTRASMVFDRAFLHGRNSGFNAPLSWLFVVSQALHASSLDSSGRGGGGGGTSIDIQDAVCHSAWGANVFMESSISRNVACAELLSAMSVASLVQGWTDTGLSVFLQTDVTAVFSAAGPGVISKAVAQTLTLTSATLSTGSTAYLTSGACAVWPDLTLQKDGLHAAVADTDTVQSSTATGGAPSWVVTLDASNLAGGVYKV